MHTCIFYVQNTRDESDLSQTTSTDIFTYVKSPTEELVVVIIMGCIEPKPPHAGAGGGLLDVTVPEHCRDQHQHKKAEHFQIQFKYFSAWKSRSRPINAQF